MNSAMISGDLNHKDERRHLSPSLLRMKNAYVCTLQNCLILKKKQKKNKYPHSYPNVCQFTSYAKDIFGSLRCSQLVWTVPESQRPINHLQYREV